MAFFSDFAKKANITAWRDKVETFVQGVGEEIGVLDELRYEWRRLQTFTKWPHDSPRPLELAKAGFFYSPIKSEPDRCAHFCTDKFFSSWEPDDDPMAVLTVNCPECPFVLGTSNNVPLPSAYVAYNNNNTEGIQTPPTKESLSAHLGDFLNGAVQRAAGPGATVGASKEAEDSFSAPLRSELGGLVGGGEQAPAAEESLQVTRKTKGKGKKGSSRRIGQGSDDGAAPRVWEGAGGGRGEAFPYAVVGDNGSEGGSEGGYTPRTTPRPALSREELAALQGAVGGAVGAMQKQWEGQLTKLDGRLAGLRERVGGVTGKVMRVSESTWLDPKRAELGKVQEEIRAQREELEGVKGGLGEAKKELERSQKDLERLKKQEELAEEYDRRVREATEELQDLEDNKGQLEGEISELEDEKQQLKDEGEAERQRIRDSMTGIKTAKKEAEQELVEVQDTIAMRKRELEALEEKLREMGRREGMGLSRETELESRASELKQKEEDLRQREEWLLQKEGQQRAAKR